MISELVAGSAWICPPVLGWLVAVLLPMGAVVPPVGLGWARVAVGVPGVLVPPWPVSAARKVTASLVASAFFR